MRQHLVRGLLLFGLSAAGVASLRAQQVRGVITDRTTGKPVGDGQVLLVTEQRLGIAQATTNDSGRFVVVAPGPGKYRLQFQRPGYRLVITPSFDLRGTESVDYAIQVTPLPPVALDTAIIEGQAVPRYLEGFYRRRAAGWGAFLTRQEFERWYPREVTDIVRRVQVFDIIPNPDRGRNGDFRDYKIQSRRGVPNGFGPVNGECPPLLYLDGTLMGSSYNVNVDDVLAVGVIEAVEFYEGGVQVPAEFQANGSSCGVIAVWTRMEGGEIATGQHRIAVGGQVGGQWMGGRLEYGRAGVQASIGLIGPIEFYPAVNFYVRSWHGSAVPRSGWQLLMSLRGRPLGSSSPWYVGGGLTMIDVQDEAVGTGLFPTEQSIEHAVLLTGVTLPLQLLFRPVIEVQLVDPAHPRMAELHLYTGLTIRVH